MFLLHLERKMALNKILN